VRFPPLVAGLLEHAKGTVVALDVAVGAIDILPSEGNDHLFKLVLGQLLQRPRQEGVGLIVRVADQPDAPIAGLLTREALLEESVNLPVEAPRQVIFPQKTGPSQAQSLCESFSN